MVQIRPWAQAHKGRRCGLRLPKQRARCETRGSEQKAASHARTSKHGAEKPEGQDRLWGQLRDPSRLSDPWFPHQEKGEGDNNIDLSGKLKKIHPDSLAEYLVYCSCSVLGSFYFGRRCLCPYHIGRL